MSKEFNREEWAKSFEKQAKEQRKVLIENLRIPHQAEIKNPNTLNIMNNGILNAIEDEAYSLDMSVKNIVALDLEKYYKVAPVKDRDGFVTIMCYEDCKFEGAYLFLGAMKAMANIVKNNKFIKTNMVTGLYGEYNWQIESCMNIANKQRYINGCLHAKKTETMSTHHDYTFLFGCNAMGQRYIQYRILSRVPNEKIYA